MNLFLQAFNKRSLVMLICAIATFGHPTSSYAAADYAPEQFDIIEHFDSLIPNPSEANLRSQYFEDPLIESFARGFSNKYTILDKLKTAFSVSDEKLDLIENEATKIYNSNKNLSKKYKLYNFVIAKQVEYITNAYGIIPETTGYTLTKFSSDNDALITVNKDNLINLYLTYSEPNCGGEASLGPYKAKKGWIHDFTFSVFVAADQIIILPNNFYSPEDWSLRQHSGVRCSMYQVTYHKTNTGGNVVKTFKKEKLVLPVLDNDEVIKNPSRMDIYEHPELAFSDLFSKALDGDPTSQYELSKRLRAYQINPRGIHFLYQAAENGEPEAQYAFAQYLEKIKPDSYTLFSDTDLRNKTIERFLSASCKGGIEEACLKQKTNKPDPLVEGKRLYELGLEATSTMNYAKALNYYNQAVALGFTDAHYNLGIAYTEGQSVEINHYKAREHYEKGANAGHLPSMLRAAFMCAQGQGGPKDFDKADKWLSILSDKGLTQAITMRGAIALQRNDPITALELFKTACKRGDKLSCDVLKQF